MDRRAFIITGAAAGLAAGCAHVDEAPAAAPDIAGAWSAAFADEGLPGLVLRQVRLEVSPEGEARIAQVGQAWMSGRAGRSRAPITLVFDPVPGVFTGGRITGALAGPDRIEGMYQRGNGFETEVAFVRGEQTFDAPSMPALTQKGLENTHAEVGLPIMAALAGNRRAPLKTWTAGAGAEVFEQLWRLAGLTKSLTGTLAGRLVEQGAVSWDDTIGQVLGAAAPDMLPSYSAVSLKHLLSHKGGLKPDLPAAQIRAYSARAAEGPVERLRYAREVLALAPGGPVGVEETTHSNAGYIVAAAIIEQRTGRSFDQLLIEEVLKPLGLQSYALMPDAAVTPLGAGRGGAQAAKAAWLPANGMAMTLADFARFMTAHRERQSGFLRPQTWAALHADPFGGNYAMGWFTNPRGQIGHPSFENEVGLDALIDPADGRMALVAASVGGPDAAQSVRRVLFRAFATVTENLPPPLNETPAAEDAQ